MRGPYQHHSVATDSGERCRRCNTVSYPAESLSRNALGDGLPASRIRPGKVLEYPCGSSTRLDVRPYTGQSGPSEHDDEEGWWLECAGPPEASREPLRLAVPCCRAALTNAPRGRHESDFVSTDATHPTRIPYRPAPGIRAQCMPHLPQNAKKWPWPTRQNALTLVNRQLLFRLATVGRALLACSAYQCRARDVALL